MKIALQIKVKRHKLGLNQQDLAKLAKLSPEYIGKIEREEILNVGIKTLEKIAKALKTSVIDLMREAA